MVQHQKSIISLNRACKAFWSRPGALTSGGILPLEDLSPFSGAFKVVREPSCLKSFTSFTSFPFFTSLTSFVSFPGSFSLLSTVVILLSELGSSVSLNSGNISFKSSQTLSAYPGLRGKTLALILRCLFST